MTVAEAYSITGAAWREGPERIYGRLADVLVDASPVPLTGQSVLDLGAGTGAASRALRRAGARPIAADVALGMLATLGPDAPPRVAADALALPLRNGAVGGVVAAFSLNHLTHPVAGLREAARVTRPGGVVLASAYAEDDTHPVKEAVESAASARGWRAPDWYVEVRRDAVPRLATVQRVNGVAEEAGLAARPGTFRVEAVRVPFPELSAPDLVAWRMGLAQMAPFVAALSSASQRELAADAIARLGPEPPPLVRSILVLIATR
jgi:SAM-dependent methyltransferase